jgi:DNA-binding Lrp family transcriptional regulator
VYFGYRFAQIVTSAALFVDLDHIMDNTDQRLVALLRQNARASVTTLASELELSRATVQTRLDRLVSSQVIRRFTVEMDSPSADDLIRAVMLIELQGNLARTVTSRLRQIPQIVSVFSTNGAWDLVAQIEVKALEEFDETLRIVREIKGVLNSETCLLLSRAI